MSQQPPASRPPQSAQPAQSTQPEQPAPTSRAAPPSRSTPPPVKPRQPHPDRNKLRDGAIGIFTALWFIVQIALYLVGWILHHIARALMAASRLGEPLAPAPPPPTRPPSRTPGGGAP